MKLELRNIKHFEPMSEETNCFTADVWIDGAKAGDVRNEGHGGCNMYSPYTLAERLNKFAATLPVKVAYINRVNGANEPFEMREDADSVIDDLLVDWLMAKDLKKLMRDKAVYTAKDKGGVFTTNRLSAAQKAAMKAKGLDFLPKAWNAEHLLNVLPFDQALELYMQKGR